MVFHNRTRVSESIPRRLRDEGRWYLIPLYRLLTMSTLAAEAVEGSGSWRFADHIYMHRASGRAGVGALIDFVLLRLAAARAFRTRYEFARDQVLSAMTNRPGPGPLAVLSVPCGIPRALMHAATAIGDTTGVRLYGIDLDPEVIRVARGEVARAGHDAIFEFIEGDALEPSMYPRDLDMIVSTGFGEFLDDETLVRFLRICHEALYPGGTLVTSATARHGPSAFLLEVAEVFVHYRSGDELRELLRRAGFGTVTVTHDRTGLQTHAAATKMAA